MGVFVLSVTTLGSDQLPPILLDQLNDFANLHILNYLHLLTESLVFERRNTEIWKRLWVSSCKLLVSRHHSPARKPQAVA
jgi:hypothetical protein